MNSVYELDTIDQFQQVLEYPNLIVYKIYADWCSPCTVYKPQFEDFAKQNPGVIFISSDVSKNFIKVESLPSTIFIKNKQAIDKIIGIDMALLRQKVAQYA
jgi:thiol-disulfide isomerase/thioredoxin